MLDDEDGKAGYEQVEAYADRHTAMVLPVTDIDDTAVRLECIKMSQLAISPCTW